MIVLYQHNGMLGARHLFEQGIGKLAIDFTVCFPILSAKDGARVRDVAEWPEPFVGEAIVVAFFFLLGEPDAAKSVLRLFRRHTQAIVGIHGVMIRVTRAMRNPGSMAGA